MKVVYSKLYITHNIVCIQITFDHLTHFYTSNPRFFQVDTKTCYIFKEKFVKRKTLSCLVSYKYTVV